MVIVVNKKEVCRRFISTVVITLIMFAQSGHWVFFSQFFLLALFAIDVSRAYIDTSEDSNLHSSDQYAEKMSRLLGGIGEERPADAEIQEIVDQIRAITEERTGRKFDQFDAIRYTPQVVAGMNYFIKVQVGPNDYIHVRVFQSLSQEIELAGFQLDKKLEDPIGYF